MKSILIAVTVFFIASGTCYTQNILQGIFTRKEAKNTVVVSVGTVLLASEASIAYERKLVSFAKKEVSSVWIKGRYTRLTGRVNQDGASFLDVSAMALLGPRSSFTEIGAGVGYFPVQNTVYPTGNVGYRYQRRRGGILLRAGVGFPEMFYVGVGYGF